MQVAAALKLLEQYLAELPHLREVRHDHDQEFELWCDKVADVLKAAFGDGSEEHRRFPHAYAGAVPQFFNSPSMRQLYLRAIESRETALKSILQKHREISELERQSGKVSEAVYPAGSPYDAYKAIRELIKQSSRQLTVADPYVNSTLFDLLDNTKQIVHIRILTKDMQGDFKLAATKLKQQRGNLEVRQDPGDLHDRFLFVDGEVYHLGASIKDAGNKVFGINQLEQPQVKQAAMQIIEDIWNKSIVVV